MLNLLESKTAVVLLAFYLVDLLTRVDIILVSIAMPFLNFSAVITRFVIGLAPLRSG